MTWVILVSGGRRYGNRPALAARLDEAAGNHAPHLVVLRHGKCNPRDTGGKECDWDWAATLPREERDRLVGADWIAHWHAVDRGWAVQERPANWGLHHNRAGPIRNQGMVNEIPKPNVLVAAPGPDSRGTWDCVRRAEKARIPVVYAGAAGAIKQAASPVQDALFPDIDC